MLEDEKRQSEQIMYGDPSLALVHAIQNSNSEMLGFSKLKSPRNTQQSMKALMSPKSVRDWATKNE